MDDHRWRREPRQRPTAGPIAFPRLRREVEVDAFCATVVERCGLLLVPGAMYDQPGHIRLGFGRRDMPEALTHLDAYLLGRAW